MINLALLWHHHQPFYKDPSWDGQPGSYLRPWVRLHAIRDYYSMAALLVPHPGIHLTINLTPSLLWQIDDYTERGATDRALELTRLPVEALTPDQREEILSTFFEADWHHQIFPHHRYRELFEQRSNGGSFSDQDIRDLQMWFNLAWFGREFHRREITLTTGDTVDIRPFVEEGSGFKRSDVLALIEEQYKIMEAVVPVHRRLQDRGQIEVSTTPFYHPILPLLVDTDAATIDRPDARYPSRFAHPEDGTAQVRRAAAFYRERFGLPPRGMWPAEGAVSESTIAPFARQGLSWIASDEGVLARSGRWGYEVDDPDVLCKPYRAEHGDAAVSIFFRDSYLSNAISFYYHGYRDHEAAADEFMNDLKAHCAPHASDHVHTVVLDGENAWGSYREDGRPFLHALYDRIERDSDVRTVTFEEYLRGDPDRGLAPHPTDRQDQVYELFTGSWVDEFNSAPGVDLGTWIGELEENRAWELLGEARSMLDEAGATPETHPEAFESLYRAEGSDWFWWFGDDQDSGEDETFDELFRMHVRDVYHNLGRPSPPSVDRPVVAHDVVWTFTNPVDQVKPENRLILETNCPGSVTWWRDGGSPRTDDLSPVGGVMAGVSRYHRELSPSGTSPGHLHFRFRCTDPSCDGRGVCCRREERVVRIG